jgi:hypothetical protein
MNAFIFKTYSFDADTGEAHFHYGFEDGRLFEEVIVFAPAATYDTAVFERALFLAFMLIGVSYYKIFPSNTVEMQYSLDEWQGRFFSHVYQEGLSQFAYENELSRDDLAHFTGDKSSHPDSAVQYSGSGTLVLQSGGKDSLLVARLLQEKEIQYTPWYLSNGDTHPAVLDDEARPLVEARRYIDKAGLKDGIKNGGKNGHVPITYIVQSLAVLQTVLLGKSDILVSIAHEGEEPHHHIDDLAVTHQWSKTWQAEQDFAEYVARYISADIRIGSPLRLYSELSVAQQFEAHAWDAYGHSFSSCNVANYQQGSDNTTLKWCGNCPKCANSYLLFAPFVHATELQSLFAGQDLFTKPSLQRTFMGLLGIDGEPKPFECIGEVGELRLAYHKAQVSGGYSPLSFDVPESTVDYLQAYPAQDWAVKMLQ